MRDIVFLSHANPEDNIFAEWLSLKLLQLGYQVYCDVIDLLGGEDIFGDIENVIRNKTVKFLYIVSKASNSKEGAFLDELRLAKSVSRSNKLNNFIIPLHLDDLPYGDMNIEILRKDAIEFKDSWAAGISKLLKVLNKDNIPISQDLTPEAVANWWNIEHSKKNQVINRNEIYISNSYPIVTAPNIIHIHTLPSTIVWDTIKVIKPNNALYPYKNYVFSFIDANKITARYGKMLFIENTSSYEINRFRFDHNLDKFIVFKQRRDVVYNLLKSVWENSALAENLLPYQLSGNNMCYYFPKDLVVGDIYRYKNINNKMTYKKLSGNYRDAYWHYAIQAIPVIDKRYYLTFKSHIVFSDDGHNPWEGVKRSHKARRSMCAMWWNDKWRDLLMAAINWMSKNNDYIRLGTDNDERIIIIKKPVRYISPVSTNATMSSDMPDDYDYSDNEWDDGDSVNYNE
jgi:hypothetical protein